jgi:hypothetical protein
MRDLILQATVNTPGVRADAKTGVVTLGGTSCPEDCREFFTPLIGWMKSYLSSGSKPLRLELHETFFDTSSIRVLAYLFDLLELAHQKHRLVSVVWHPNPFNKGEFELARACAEDCSFPFEIVGGRQ